MLAWLAWAATAYLVISITCLVVLLVIARLEDRRRAGAEIDHAEACDEEVAE